MKTIESYTYGRLYFDIELTRLLMEAADTDGKIVVSKKYAAFVVLDTAYWTTSTDIEQLKIKRAEILG